MKKVSIPTLVNSLPEFADLTKKRIELRSEDAKVDKSIEELLAARRTNYKPRLSAERDGRIASLLGDETLPSLAQDQSRYSELISRKTDITRALEILEDRIAGARMKASKVATDKLKPDYLKSLTSLATVLVALHNAIAEHNAFRNAIQAEDISSAFLPQFSLPERFTSRVGPLLQEAAADGVIAKADLPKELR